MKNIYAIVGFSKQAHWGWTKRQQSLLDKWLLLKPTLIMDLHSRRILGYHAAANLFAQSHLEALKRLSVHEA